MSRPRVVDMTRDMDPRVVSERAVARQAAMLRALVAMPTHESLGVALAVLLQASHDQPEMLRAVLNEPVVREGFRGESMLAVLTRAAR